MNRKTCNLMAVPERLEVVPALANGECQQSNRFIGNCESCTPSLAIEGVSTLDPASVLEKDLRVHLVSRIKCWRLIEVEF